MSVEPSIRRHTGWTFAITSIALFMVALDNLVVTTALPVIRAELGASLSELEWIVNAYTLTFAVLLLTGAALAAIALELNFLDWTAGGTTLGTGCLNGPGTTTSFLAVDADMGLPLSG